MGRIILIALVVIVGIVGNTSYAWSDEGETVESEPTTQPESGTEGEPVDSEEPKEKVAEPPSGEPESLEIRGQTRTLSMMLVLQNKRDKIDFIKPRKNYRNEILRTEY